jgi:hypothetical protein
LVDKIKEKDGWGMSHILGRMKLHTEFWWGNLKEEDYFEDLGGHERMILKFILKKQDGGLRLD